jgi:hypothetical protein
MVAVCIPGDGVYVPLAVNTLIAIAPMLDDVPAHFVPSHVHTVPAPVNFWPSVGVSGKSSGISKIPSQ